ncbi:HEAT repeat domain-containing protein [bacterium]|nr:MAG: HEAT repeat domain-containing protein [bacterium]
MKRPKLPYPIKIALRLALLLSFALCISGRFVFALLIFAALMMVANVVIRVNRPPDQLESVDATTFESKAMVLGMPKWVRWTTAPIWLMTMFSGDGRFFRMRTEELIRLSDSEDAHDRLRATIIARYRPEFPLERLTARLEDPLFEIREAAVKALALRPDAISTLRIAESDPDPMIWAQAVAGLIDLKQPVEMPFERVTSLFSKIEHGDGHLPTVIGKLPIQHTLPFMVEALEKDSGGIMLHVYQILQQRRPESWQYFEAWLQRPEAESRLRHLMLPMPLPEIYRSGLDRLAGEGGLHTKVWARRELERASKASRANRL